MTDDSEDLRFAVDRTSEHEGEHIDTAGMMLRVKNRLRHHEGWVNHMYRDSHKGKITVGVGFELPRADVVAYSWRSKLIKRTVPLRDAVADWDKVSRLPFGPNIRAEKFDEDTKVELSDATIGFVLAKKLLDLKDKLHTEFEKENVSIDFDTLPATVQEAMFDMGWNLGPAFISGTEWPKLRAALQAGDWVTAADESHRAPPVAETRNREIHDLNSHAGDDP